MTPKIILASNSPRRREILTGLGMDFSVMVSDCDENLSEITSPDKAVCELARRKALDVAQNLSAESPTDYIVIGADTVVYDGENILGKPKNREDALNTILSLSGRTHSVYTGIALAGRIGTEDKLFTSACRTDVVFCDISKAEAEYYVKTGECDDKAGSYGIQGLGGIFVKELHGDYYNVVGLPISNLRTLMLDGFGLDICAYIAKKQ